MRLDLGRFLLLHALTTSSPFASFGRGLATADTIEHCTAVRSYAYDSGPTSDMTTSVFQAGVPWLQLDLSGTSLSSGSTLVVTSRSDGESQTLDAAKLAADGNYTAAFNGDEVTVELISGTKIRGGHKADRVVIPAVRVGDCGGIAESLCGIDDRIQSYDDRQGRIGGCTGWLLAEDVMAYAGHCGIPSSSTRMHFTYSKNSAPVDDQYAIDLPTYRFLNTGVGSDWAVARVLPNSGTGLLPGTAQGGWYTIGTVPSVTTGNNIRITGYGTHAVAELSRAQTTHFDALTAIASTYLRYIPDTTGGNSGSPVIHEETGHVVGIHTHAGCDSGGNHGTRIDRADLTAAIDFLTRSCSTHADCSDGLWCNGDETCVAGRCNYGTPPNCDDGLACTVDTCNESTDSCNHNALTCNDNDSCTTDSCVEPGGCLFTQTGAPGCCGNGQCEPGDGETCSSCWVDCCPDTGATLETWTGISGTTLSSINWNSSPNESKQLTVNDLLEGPTNVMDNYGQRIRTYIVPPVSGDYIFWIASDDNGSLRLSPDSDPTKAQEIAKVPGWSNSREWTKFTDQESLPQALVAGNYYYLEAVMKEGGGGDNFALAWQYPGQTRTVIPASYGRLNPPLPTEAPTSAPTSQPTSSPTEAPTSSPSDRPSSKPTVSHMPTDKPSESPTGAPTKSPTDAPTGSPSASPSSAPTTKTPTSSPTESPTSKPTDPCVPDGQGAPCTTSTDCCSGQCTGGNPNGRVCASSQCGGLNEQCCQPGDTCDAGLGCKGNGTCK